MAQIKITRISGLIVMSMAFLITSTAVADKPSWHDGDKHGKQHHADRHKIRERHGYQYTEPSYHEHHGPHYSGGRYFDDRDRTYANGYFVNEYRSGRCPPGLEKKHNGCLPPGQAKKWMIGRPIPYDVVYYDLPPTLAMGIGVPPPGYRFVRVASDILLIAIGTGIVMDAIYDLGLR